MRRTALASIAIVLLLGLLPATAFAWCNGPAVNGKVGNGYGSHDWILDRAIALAGAQGSWVKRTTALLATDDPDSQHTAAMYHHFVEDGTSRGAPQIVSDLYHKAIVAYQAGDMSAASKDLGTLSHYYADILQPFHVTKAANSHTSLHSQYEHYVDDHQHRAGNVHSWITNRARQPVADVRAETISAALYARSLFPSLLTTFGKSHSVTSGTPLAITKKVMSRAVNDLADIICGIASGSGEATAATTVQMTLSRTRPRQNQAVGILVTCTDVNGDPLDGVGVKFVWHLPTGDVTYLTYTDANGYAQKYQDIGTAPIGVSRLTSTKVVVNGITTLKEAAFVPASH